jgi:hypothetical protein
MADIQIEYNQSPQAMIADLVSTEITSNSIRNIRSNTGQELLQNNIVLQEEQPSSLEQTFQLATQQQQIIYDQQGLEYASNLSFINKRDAAGNLIINGTVQEVIEEEAAQYQEMLILEAVNRLYTNRSVNRAIDTQFKYFKFPPNIITQTAPIEDIELPNINVDSIDSIFARYRPSENRAILTTTSGILMDFVEDGILQKVTNRYSISPDAKNSGNDLRVRAKISHRYDGTGIGTAYFFIYKEGPNYGLNRQYRGGFANTSLIQPNLPGSINQYEVQDLLIDIIIPNSEFEIGDQFGISGLAGQTGHTVIAQQTYLAITDASKNVDTWNQQISTPAQAVSDLPDTTTSSEQVLTINTNTSTLSAEE